MTLHLIIPTKPLLTVSFAMDFNRHILLFVISLLLTLHSLSAQETVQSLLWITPSGAKPNFSLTFMNGQSIPLSWNNYTTHPTSFPINNVDLWITSFDWNVNDYHVKLKSTLRSRHIKQYRVPLLTWRQPASISLAAPGSFTWTIDIPDQSLAASAKYVLRFKEPTDNYDQNTPELSSPGFLVLQSAASSSTSSSSSSSSVSTSSSSTIISSSATTSFSATSAPSTEGSHGLSTGAKVGIGVGAAVGALAVAIIAIILLLRKKKAKKMNAAEPAPYEVVSSTSPEYQPAPQNEPYEISGKPHHPATYELGDS